jgi:hypothetical protein
MKSPLNSPSRSSAAKNLRFVSGEVEICKPQGMTHCLSSCQIPFFDHRTRQTLTWKS